MKGVIYGVILILFIVLGFLFIPRMFMDTSKPVDFTMIQRESVPEKILDIMDKYEDQERALAVKYEDKIYVIVTRGEKEYGINMDKISAIERVFLEISMQSLKRVFENQGYKIEYPNNMNEENNEENIKNIIEDFKAKNLVTYENGCEVILLDKYNMPPYII